MHRDPKLFENPRVFNPDRYYQATPDGKLDPEASLVEGHWSFGFGRRYGTLSLDFSFSRNGSWIIASECPGNYVAGQILWGAIANLLWAFDISKAKDANGNDIDVDPDVIPWRAGVNV